MTELRRKKEVLYSQHAPLFYEYSLNPDSYPKDKTLMMLDLAKQINEIDREIEKLQRQAETLDTK